MLVTQEVAKKGRPVKQCEHCRELRKSKAVHVKCLCATPPPKPTLSEAGPSSESLHLLRGRGRLLTDDVAHFRSRQA